MPENIYAVIMAGGRGERFWPECRANRPKQLLNLFGNAPLIEQTVLRLQGFVPFHNILIITNEVYLNASAHFSRRFPRIISSENPVQEIRRRVLRLRRESSRRKPARRMPS